jgi:hypothetical protein
VETGGPIRLSHYYCRQAALKQVWASGSGLSSVLAAMFGLVWLDEKLGSVWWWMWMKFAAAAVAWDMGITSPHHRLPTTPYSVLPYYSSYLGHKISPSGFRTPAAVLLFLRPQQPYLYPGGLSPFVTV